jgi:hypothetical protein
MITSNAKGTAISEQESARKARGFQQRRRGMTLLLSVGQDLLNLHPNLNSEIRPLILSDHIQKTKITWLIYRSVGHLPLFFAVLFLNMQADSETCTESEPDCQLFHPLFSSLEGDVTLGAKGGTLFRVHSFTLKTTSGWFRTMFSLPQQGTPSPPIMIHLDEDVQILESLLRMVCGLPIIRPDSYDTVDALLYATEKYDMPGPTSIIRHLIMTPPLTEEPLRLYAVACRYGWTEEAKIASEGTLKYNLHDPEHRSSLLRLGTEAILNLFELHRSRREGLRARLNQFPFIEGRMRTCGAAHCTWQVDYHHWRELKYKIILEMDVRPLGDSISTGLTEWPEAIECWIAKCSNPKCQHILYDEGETLRVIQEYIRDLPSTI